MTTHRDETPTRTASVEDAGAEPEPAATPAAERRRFRYTLPGAWTALAFACLAFTPSLLPRGALLQGVVCGISGAIGYGRCPGRCAAPTTGSPSGCSGGWGGGPPGPSAGRSWSW
jgi:uncharacterized membrane protein